MKWIDLSEYWSLLRRQAEGRNAMHSSDGKIYDPKPVTVHFKGLCGEKVVSLVSGLALDSGLYASGDDGADFAVDGQGVDVKTSTYLASPDLKVNCNVRRWADCYILVVLDMTHKRGYVAGWATQEQVKGAEKKDYGYGQRYAIPEYELQQWGQAGLPNWMGEEDDF